MSVALWMMLLGCPAAEEESDPPTVEAIEPPYICPGNPETPCSLAPETCMQVVDCMETCERLVTLCTGAERCEAEGNPALYLCGVSELAANQCRATCGGTSVSNCADWTEFVCAELYDTCEDINTCWSAGTGL